MKLEAMSVCVCVCTHVCVCMCVCGRTPQYVMSEDDSRESSLNTTCMYTHTDQHMFSAMYTVGIGRGERDGWLRWHMV